MTIKKDIKEILAKYDKEDIHIDVENNVLTISGTIHKHNEKQGEQFHRKERFTGHFNRSISLPSRVNTENIKATYKNGVLEVRIPKVQEGNKKQINVEFH